jgi:hypothetical protein
MKLSCARVSTFAGGIANSGTIVVKSIAGIEVFGDLTFGGGIINSGTIVAKSVAGIHVFNVLTFGGGIINSAAISTAGRGILVGGATFLAPGVSSFSGDVVNTGKISAKTGISISKSTIAGAIVDSGTIKASHGIPIDSASEILSSKTAIDIAGPTFTGGILPAPANHDSRVLFLPIRTPKPCRERLPPVGKKVVEPVRPIVKTTYEPLVVRSQIARSLEGEMNANELGTERGIFYDPAKREC